MLKMHFQVFSLVSEKVQGFSSDRNMVMSGIRCCYQCSFTYRTVSQFFEILIFSQEFGETLIMSLKWTSFPMEQIFQTNFKKSEKRFCRWKTAKNNNAKTNVSSNIPCTFLLFKVSAFLQIFFSTSFQNVSFSLK